MTELVADPGDFTPEALAKIAPTCPYCGELAVLVGGDVIYPHRADLHGKWHWYCAKDAAWVGIHRANLKPLGRLANRELRGAKIMAHAAFDPLWKRKAQAEGIAANKARGKGYKWLADQLGIPREECHIGMMDVAMCRRVVHVIRNRPRGTRHE